jgi:hypothetical protein
MRARPPSPPPPPPPPEGSGSGSHPGGGLGLGSIVLGSTGVQPFRTTVPSGFCVTFGVYTMFGSLSVNVSLAGFMSTNGLFGSTAAFGSVGVYSGICDLHEPSLSRNGVHIVHVGGFGLHSSGREGTLGLGTSVQPTKVGRFVFGSMATFPVPSIQ